MNPFDELRSLLDRSVSHPDERDEALRLAEEYGQEFARQVAAESAARLAELEAEVARLQEDSATLDVVRKDRDRHRAEVARLRGEGPRFKVGDRVRRKPPFECAIGTVLRPSLRLHAVGVQWDGVRPGGEVVVNADDLDPAPEETK
jgi:hypothetical protein